MVIAFILVRIEEAETKSFLINCGTNSSVNVDGRRWVGDTAPGNNVTLSSEGIEAYTASFTGDSLYAPLYTTALVFTDSLNYTFEGTNGSYFLRLHFYPFSFENHNVNDSSFAVEVNGLKLVSECNVPNEIAHKNSYLQSSGGNSSLSTLVKEFFFYVEGDAIVLEFVPTKGSFGFVSAIEIIPVMNKLFVDSVHKVGGNGASSSLNVGKRVIQTMYRLNIGGPTIRPNQDSDLRRTWEMDSSYMVNADAGSEISNNANITYASPNDTSVAPLLVYRTARSMSNTEVMEKRFNMSWKFEVDPGFDYLIRLHFCELVFDMANQRNFRIYIDNQTAADNFDVFVRAGGMNKAYHQDYFDVLSSNIKMLWIQLGPDTATGSAGTDALLNGLEIFKLSKNGNLAYVENYGNQGSSKRSRTSTIWVSIGAEWAMRWQKQRSLETILDPNLDGKYSLESLVRFAEIAEKCLADEGKSRPTMGEVLWHLEYVLQVQEAWLRLDGGDESFAGSRLLRNLEEMHEDAGVDDKQDNLDAKTEDDSEATVRETNRSGAVVVGADEFSQLVSQ
ncbi:hypothetical protein RJ639_019763 [Escallonia herrerae]|uniref:Malectin-like domain-containing protein n=1 Tax=Escallonia herrerae TaxID=1293975 RepID=A0AA88VAA2_9ASTE|nr:hypothetical protein RJ639_019763 [Escallonia herrerae]